MFSLLILPLTLAATVVEPTARQAEIPVSTDQLKTHVQALTSIEPPRNFRHIASLQRAGDYILETFRKCTQRINVQAFKAEGREYRNIIASFGPGIPGTTRIVVGAHYDVCRDQPGADDNASGVAALLELARLFSTLKPHLTKRIDLAAYGLEEPPYFRSPFMGSAVHARSLAAAGEKVQVMISLDALGYFSEHAGPTPYILPHIRSGEFVPGRTTAVVGRNGEEGFTHTLKKYMAEQSKLAVLALNLPADTPGVDFSDHLNFWNQGYAAVMVTNFFISPNPNYHKPSDTMSSLDFDKIGEIVKGIYHALNRL